MAHGGTVQRELTVDMLRLVLLLFTAIHVAHGQTAEQPQVGASLSSGCNRCSGFRAFFKIFRFFPFFKEKGKNRAHTLLPQDLVETMLISM